MYLKHTVGIEDDANAAYSDLAGHLVIPFDETLGVHPEYEGYPGNLIKQADVVLLHYPLQMEMTTE
jgi:trehalose/maltose hydrolase-like predicted phosphorylase